MFAASGPFGPGLPRANGAKRSTYGSYASSIISQDAGPGGTDTASISGSAIGMSDRAASSLAYSQSDRLRRRASFSSMAGTSDLGSVSQYDYKSTTDDSTDVDDMKSQYTGTQSGITTF